MVYLNEHSRPNFFTGPCSTPVFTPSPQALSLLLTCAEYATHLLCSGRSSRRCLKDEPNRSRQRYSSCLHQSLLYCTGRAGFTQAEDAWHVFQLPQSTPGRSTPRPHQYHSILRLLHITMRPDLAERCSDPVEAGELHCDKVDRFLSSSHGLQL